MIDNYRLAVRERFHRMTRARRDDGDNARAGDLGHAVDGQFEFALDVFVYLLLGDGSARERTIPV